MNGEVINGIDIKPKMKIAEHMRDEFTERQIDNIKHNCFWFKRGLNS